MRRSPRAEERRELDALVAERVAELESQAEDFYPEDTVRDLKQCLRACFRRPSSAKVGTELVKMLLCTLFVRDVGEGRRVAAIVVRASLAFEQRGSPQSEERAADAAVEAAPRDTL